MGSCKRGPRTYSPGAVLLYPSGTRPTHCKHHPPARGRNPVKQWPVLPRGGILTTWLDRRHHPERKRLRLAIYAEYDAWTAKGDARERSEAKQFKPGACPNPLGRGGKKQARPKSGEPVPRDHKAEHPPVGETLTSDKLLSEVPLPPVRPWVKLCLGSMTAPPSCPPEPFE